MGRVLFLIDCALIRANEAGLREITLPVPVVCRLCTTELFVLQSMVMSDFGRYSNEFLLNAMRRLETIGILDLNNWDFRAEFIAKLFAEFLSLPARYPQYLSKLVSFRFERVFQPRFETWFPHGRSLRRADLEY